MHLYISIHIHLGSLGQSSPGRERGASPQPPQLPQLSSPFLDGASTFHSQGRGPLRKGPGYSRRIAEAKQKMDRDIEIEIEI